MYVSISRPAGIINEKHRGARKTGDKWSLANVLEIKATDLSAMITAD